VRVRESERAHLGHYRRLAGELRPLLHRKHAASLPYSRRGRRGRPVLEEPVLGAADSERRNCPSILGVLSVVPEAIR